MAKTKAPKRGRKKGEDNKVTIRSYIKTSKVNALGGEEAVKEFIEQAIEEKLANS